MAGANVAVVQICLDERSIRAFFGCEGIFYGAETKIFVEPPDCPQTHRRSAAEGFVERGLYIDANAKLEEIDFDVRQVPEVLMVRLDIYEDPADAPGS